MSTALLGYVRAAAVLALCTVLGTVVISWLSVTDIAVLYLLGVAVVASWATRRQAIVAAVLSVALFDFFFVPPRFTFAVSDLHYVFTFGVMLVTALVVSRLAERVRSEARAAATRERGTSALYPMLGDLVDATTLDDVVAVLRRHVRDAFGAQIRVLLRRDGQLSPMGGSSGFDFDHHLADLAFQSWEAVGRGTKTYAEATSLYLPLVGSHGRLGVLQVRPDDPARFAEPAVQWLLQTFAAQAALAVERVSTVG
jgi:two-component system, OmpR family, sensor histidine kinase KdpD